MRKLGLALASLDLVARSGSGEVVQSGMDGMMSLRIVIGSKQSSDKIRHMGQALPVCEDGLIN